MSADVAGIQRAGEAVEDARRAAATAGVVIRDVDDAATAGTIGPFLRALWGREADPAPYDLVMAMVHAGNYVSGAYADGRLVGALVAFTGIDAGLHLHSHILGVVPEARARGVGFALKLDQRAWALRNGITRIEWSTDPLIRRNVHFNIDKLGAAAVRYIPNMYGAMRDDENAGDESDRIVVQWRAERALTTTAPPPPLPSGPVVLAEGGNGEPVVTARPGGADVVLCTVPADIVAVRRGDPNLGHQWRLALRQVLGGAMGEGWRLLGLGDGGAYVLSAP